MSEHAAVEKVSMPVSEAPEIFTRRLQEKFADAESYKRYLSWCHSSETAENIRLLRDVFCRPVAGPVTPEESVWHLGFNSGAWSILDVITAIRRPEAFEAEPEANYDDPVDSDLDKREKSAANKKKG